MYIPARNTKTTGFTLIELLVVVSLIAIITGAIVPTFSAYIQNQNVRQAQEQIKSDLRTVENRALTGYGNSSGTIQYWGLLIRQDNATSYYYFSSATNDLAACNAASTAEKSNTIPGSVVIRNGVASNWCIFFSLLNGDVSVIKAGYSSGAFPVISVGSQTGTNCGYVSLNSAGLITKTSAVNNTCEAAP
ncbi:MAG TPA: type II secretion system protein [Candidatus Saccharimonadales bacterium]|nr:type II secretion system protein [Candidatus Saccharimonadales bacterium]